MAALDQFFAFAAASGRERDLGQSSLFGGGGGTGGGLREPSLPDIPPYAPDQSLSLEKELLGFYLSGHPLDGVRDEVERLADARLGETSELQDLQTVRLAGVVTDIRRSQTRKGKAMASIVLEDFTGTAELLVFGETLDVCAPLLRKEAALVVNTKVSCREDEEPKFIAQQVYTLEQAKAEFARSMWLTLTEASLNDSTLDALEDLFLKHSGNVPIYFKVIQNGEPRVVQSRRYRLKTSLDVLRQVQEMLGQSQVKIG
jgi:DNA polymerase-3 subunit alpha